MSTPSPSLSLEFDDDLFKGEELSWTMPWEMPDLAINSNDHDFKFGVDSKFDADWDNSWKEEMSNMMSDNYGIDSPASKREDAKLDAERQARADDSLLKLTSIDPLASNTKVRTEMFDNISYELPLFGVKQQL